MLTMGQVKIGDGSSPPQSMTDFAADRIRDAIINGLIALGTKVSEKELALALGISKTPVREALLRLKNEGIIEIRPRIGTFVFKLTLEEIEKIAEFRRVLEPSAIEMAIQRNPARLAAALGDVVQRMRDHIAEERLTDYVRDDATFHQHIFDLCGNDYLIEGYRSISSKVQSIRNRLSHDRDVLEKSIRDHADILDAVKERAAAKAKAFTLEHLTIHEGVTEGMYDRYLKPTES